MIMANQESYHWNNSGTKQSERLPRELSGNYVKIDERSFEDLIKQVAEYAKHLHYYNNNNQIDGDWSAFFSEIYDYERQEVDMAHLENMMENASVKPHLALMLAFLKLFLIQQENLNGITERHLDFYYKDILGFEPRKGEAGKVTVFLELNKNASHAFIPKGTLFEAGKDADGKPIRYEAADEMSVNRIKIASVKTLSKSDGLVDLKFSKSKETSENTETDNPAASNKENKKPYSIIITSPILNQPDGTKAITFNVAISAETIKECTTSKGWSSIENLSSISEAIVPYDPAIHGEGFDTTYPMLRLSTSDAKEFNNLISNIKNLTVAVTDSQNCMIENKYGTFMNKAGFYPFGAIAAQGDWFRIVLPFDNANITNTNIIKEAETESTADTTTGAECGEIWKEAEFEKMENDMVSLKFFQNKDKTLFTLNTDNFNQNAFASEYALAMAKFIVDHDEKKIPNKPFIPEFKEPVKISYCISDLDELQMFTKTSFGLDKVDVNDAGSISKLNPFICNDGNCNDDNDNNNNDHNDKDNAKCLNLFIGLENAEPDDLLNLYLQIDPYSSHYQAEDIQWSYLKGSEWKGFTSSNFLKDSTEKLRHSGIITLRLPEEITDIDGLKWIKLSKSTPDDKPFDNILEIRTQALELAYSPQSEGAASVGVSLPAKTISKAVNSIAGIKKIEQPYDGESGKCDESDGQFKCRVSEKLRHKGRAWTGWDYERLVLEKFPQVAAAKCLSCCNEKGEFEAGAVTIMLLPGKDEIAHNPLQPKVDGRTIAEAQSYLEGIAPPFVTVHVINPNYVPIEIECAVKLRESFNDKEFYEALLNEQMIKYLSPWVNGEKDMDFSSTFNKSSLIEFMDSQYFIDYVEALTIINVKDLENDSDLMPSNPTQLFTSETKHTIQFV